MSIIKKINNKNVVLADKGVRDHNLLMGRDSYGAHPINAIYGLTDRLTGIESDISGNSQDITTLNTKVGRIQVVDNNNNSFTFTNGENQTTTISFDTSALTTALNNHANLIETCTNKDSELAGSIITTLNTAKNYTDSEINSLSGTLNARIDLLDGQGGYLTPNNFGSSITQSILTNYALQELNLNDSRDIPNLIRVKNTYDSNVWVLTNSASIFKWTNEGVDTIEVASLESYGVVKSSIEDYEGSVDSLGHITINGLEEKLSDLEGEIDTLSGVLENCGKISIRTYYVSNSIKFPGLTANNITTIVNNLTNNLINVVEYIEPDTNEVYELRVSSAIKTNSNIYLFIDYNTIEKNYILKYNLDKQTEIVELTVKEIN